MSRTVASAIAGLPKTLWKSYLIGLARPFTTTSVLNAEPPRKKRRIDPILLKQRTEKKIRKTEREISKLETASKQPIPILEYQPSNSDIRDLESRPGRTLEDLGCNKSQVIAAGKLWSIYRSEESKMQKKSINRIIKAQDFALETIKKLDQGLYNRTVAVDDITLIPYSSSHMYRETPPNPEYVCPDGYVKDVSKEWIM